MFKAFLIPVGQHGYQPYCEPVERQPAFDGDAPRGVLRRLRDRFQEMLAEAEVERRRAARGETRPPASTRVGRLRDRVLCYVAEHVAEKRLLWHLRHEQTAVLVHPDDISSDEALRLLRAEMRRDTDRHLLWLVVNTVLFIASGALALVPGPNVIAYFLGFFVVSHYLSWRGARHGLGSVTWQAEPSAPLAELRAALHLEAPVRDSSIRDIAARLSLEDLPTFVKRVALRVVPHRA